MSSGADITVDRAEAAARGAAILRVHDVAETVQALRVQQAMLSGDRPHDTRLHFEP